MKTFPGWRHAGHAMRWARTNSVVHQADPWADGVAEHFWTGWQTSAGVTLMTATDNDGGKPALTIQQGDLRLELDPVDHAQQVLNILVALGLIPDHFATAHNTGRLAGHVEYAQQLMDVRDTYDAVQAAGEQVGEQLDGDTRA